MSPAVEVVDFLRTTLAVLLDGVLLVARGSTPAETERRVTDARAALSR